MYNRESLSRGYEGVLFLFKIRVIEVGDGTGLVTKPFENDGKRNCVVLLLFVLCFL